MNQTLYPPNKKHLANKHIKEYWTTPVPIQKVEKHKNCLITDTNHLFSNGKYVKTGLYRAFDDKHLSQKQKAYILVKNLLFVKNKLKEPHVWIYDCWIENYFHWMCEVLPRIWQCHNEYPTETILLPKRTKEVPFINKSLDILGINYRYYADQTATSLPSVTTVTTTPYWAIMSPHILQRFRNDILKNLMGQNSPPLAKGFSFLEVKRSIGKS